MGPCERWESDLLDHADGLPVGPAAIDHFRSCGSCARELALQRLAAEALESPSEAFRLASPFLPPVIPRRRDRALMAAAGAGVMGVFLGLHGLVDPEPWTALASSFGVLTPFSRSLFQQAGWAAVLGACAGLAAAGWCLRRLLQRA